MRLASQSIAKIGGHEMGILIITHHEQLLEYNQPHFTHVMLGGRIVETGGPELAVELHKQGYDRIRAAPPRVAGRRGRDADRGKCELILQKYAKYQIRNTETNLNAKMRMTKNAGSFAV